MFSLIAAAVSAVQQGDPGGAPGATAGDLFQAWEKSGAGDPGISRVILALAVVLVLIGASLWVLKRFFRVGGRGTGCTGLRVLDTLPLGGKRMIQVVRIYDRTLVIGVTGEHVELLTELSEEETCGAPAPGVPAPKIFENILPFRRLRKDGTGKEGVAHG